MDERSKTPRTLGDLGPFVTRVRMKPDSLLHNFPDIKNVKAGVVGIFVRNSTQNYFHL